MPGKPQFCNSLFRSVSLVGTVVLFVMTLVPAGAQQNIPLSAREAATMPEFTSRLARPAGVARATPSASAKRSGRSLQDSGVIYDNGPLDGNTNAWNIGGGIALADSFTVRSRSSTIKEINFYTWMYPGDQALSVDWSVTSDPLGGTVYGSGTAQLTDVLLFTNGFGYEIHKETVAGLNLNLDPGTYYLNFQNAVTLQGNILYWDENDGVGCQSPDCPSLAQLSGFGWNGSQSFDITGVGSIGSCDSTRPVLASKVEQADTLTAPPSPTQSFKTVYSFTGAADGATPNGGLTVDAAGNLYGTSFVGYVASGAAFRLVPRDSLWAAQVLREFTGAGGEGIYSRARVIFGPDGSLYGTTSSGGQQGGLCSVNGCGTVLNLKPKSYFCQTALCAWNETTLYRFQGLGGAFDDAAIPSYGDLVFDTAGNMYGTTLAAGGTRHGALYEMTPSGGSWTENVLYGFGYRPGVSKGQGAPPMAVLRDGTGNFYVPTEYGTLCGNYAGTILYLTPSGSGWQENLVWGFQGKDDGGFPFGGLISDQAGNLYGTTTSAGTGGGGTVFMLSPNWELTTLYSFTGLAGGGPRASLTMDSSGNLYGTTYRNGQFGYGSVFKLTHSVGGWIFTSLYDFTGDSDGGFPVSNVTIAPNGKLYGTAQFGGAYGLGGVWEIMP
jgi:uncharacterized repeat protein (TIGR03803 family)